MYPHPSLGGADARLPRRGRYPENPSLVSRDPFGEGWLCEIAGVAPADVERLYDRDGFFAYLQFEMEARRLGLAPTLNATYRLEAGEPWPQDFRVEMGGRLILRPGHPSGRRAGWRRSFAA